MVVQTPKYIEALNWYLDHLGLIVSDFCHYPDQRERGPILSFIRCDRGSSPPITTPWRWRWVRSTATCIRRIRL